MPDSVTPRASSSDGSRGAPPQGSVSPDRTAITPQSAIVGGSSSTRPPGEGSSVSGRLAVSLEDDKTVISKRPPIIEPVTSQLATPSEMGRILVGERLGHFQLEEFVGGGGMGAVFRATDTMLGRTVAVKVLSREQTDDETLLRFQKEAQNAARLDHERIARVYYVNEDKGWHYIVFEYIDGVNVRDLVDQQGPLSLDEAVYYTLQVAEALRHASKRDVVHRDIKPSNILVMADGRVKLVDMGLARSHQVEASNNDLTQSGVTLGTFDYISPEQAREPRNADVRSDIYSLGCTLYFMLTGRPPFPEGTVLQKLLSHSSDAPPDPRLYRPDIPDDICRVLMKMLAKSPTQRFQSPDELIADLLRIGDRLGLERTTNSGVVWVARPDANVPWYEKHLPWAAPVVTLILVIFALEWLTAAPNDRLSPPKPNLLPPITAIPSERRPGAPTIPVARKTDLDKKRAASGGAASEKPTTTNQGTETAPPATDGGIKETPATPTDDNPMSPGTASPIETAADVVPIRLLLVGPASTPHTADAQVVTSLTAALKAAEKLPDLEAIELHFDGPRSEQSLIIDSPDLTVRAAPGRTPVLVFRPTIDSPVDEHRMVRLPRGSVTFQGVQFRLEVPTERPVEGWALFQLSNGASLLLDRCAMTVQNSAITGALSQSGVSFFEVQPPIVNDLEAIEEDEIGRPLIRMFSTLARGEASLVRSDAGVPLRLEWTQGLLATTERVAEIGGAMQLSARWPRVEIELENVTAAVRSGLCLLRSRSDAPRHPGVRFSATDCILLTDPSASLIEHRTLDMFDDLKRKHPLLDGHGTVFSGARQYWRVLSQRTTEPVEAPLNIPMERGTEFGFSAQAWSETVMWKALPSPMRPVYTHTKADYLLSDDPANPALRRGEAAAGFDVSVLPEFAVEPPAVPVPPITPPAIDPMSSPVEPMPTNSATTAPATGMSDKMKMMMTPMPSGSSGAKPVPKPMDVTTDEGTEAADSP